MLLAVAPAAAVSAARLKIPESILLVLTGVVLALVPGLPTVELGPELLLLLVLPPVIYSSAVNMSWREFKFNLRPMSLLAVGCTLFTTAAVAAAAHVLLGLAWPVARRNQHRRIPISAYRTLNHARLAPPWRHGGDNFSFLPS